MPAEKTFMQWSLCCVIIIKRQPGITRRQRERHFDYNYYYRLTYCLAADYYIVIVTRTVHYRLNNLWINDPFKPIHQYTSSEKANWFYSKSCLRQCTAITVVRTDTTVFLFYMNYPKMPRGSTLIVIYSGIGLWNVNTRHNGSCETC